MCKFVCAAALERKKTGATGGHRRLKLALGVEGAQVQARRVSTRQVGWREERRFVEDSCRVYGVAATAEVPVVDLSDRLCEVETTT